MRNGHMVALTPNSILNKCKRKLGIKTFPLPLTDEELLDVLYEDTLPTFSKFYPRYATLKIDLKELEKAEFSTDQLPQVSYGRRAYHLDISRYGEDLVIVDIEDVQPLNSNLQDIGNYRGGFQSGYDLFMGAFANAQMEAMINVPIIHFFEAPDVLIIDEPGIINRNMVSITFLLMHAYDLSTIKITYIDKLTKLFMLDLQITLFPLLKHMDKIDTTFGQIDLKIDSWENADDKREEFTNDMETNFLSHRRKVFRV